MTEYRIAQKLLVPVMNERAGGAGVLWALAALCLLAGPAQASLLRDGKATVVNGNELMVGEVRFRFRDADAFELGQECWSAKVKFDCGVKAKETLEEIVAGKIVICGAGSVDDATCWIAPPLKGGRGVKLGDNLAEQMIRRGWALARPDLAYDLAKAKALCALEAEAKRLRRGVWREYKFALPYFHRGEKDKTREQVSCGNAPVLPP